MCKGAQLLFIFIQPEKENFFIAFPSTAIERNFYLTNKSSVIFESEMLIYTYNVDVDDDDDDITTFFQ